MKRQTIKLAQGEEVVINGFVVRAIGPKGLDGLSVYKSQVMVDARTPETERKQRDYHLYAGIRDEITISSTICIGTVSNLARSTGWNGAVEKAQAYLNILDS